MAARRDPTRRNRNIGTTKRGHGLDNRLVIPWPARGYYVERLRAPREHRFVLHGAPRVALVEEPSPGQIYGCTVHDLLVLLALLPPTTVEGLQLFLFRRPTRKQRILASVWGRYLDHAAVGPHRGAALVIEAQTLAPLRWSTSIDPENRRELDRLRADGHEISTSRRGITIGLSPASLRNTTLFRTVLHEVGHHVDVARHLDRPFETSADEEAAQRALETRTRSAREDFAHRFAASTMSALRALGHAPFPPQWDAPVMDAADIRREWFVE